MPDSGIEQKVDKLYLDFYIGDGPQNPPMTTRVALMESAIMRFGRNSSKTVWLLLAILGTIVGDILARSIGH